MQLPDTKSIQKFIKMMRKEGVSHLKIGDFELSLDHSALFPDKPGREAFDPARIQTDEISEEALLFYSSAGIPPEQSGAQ